MATSSAPDEVLYFGGHPHDGQQFYYWIGRTITSWADIEHQLFQLFLKCIVANRALAVKLFDKPPTIALKLLLVDDALSTYLSAYLYKDWSKIHKVVSNNIKFRNALAHNPVHTRTVTTVKMENQVLLEVGQTILVHFLNSHAHKKTNSPENWIHLADIKAHFDSIQDIMGSLRRLNNALPPQLTALGAKSPQQRSRKRLDSSSLQQSNEKPSQVRQRQRKPSRE